MNKIQKLIELVKPYYASDDNAHDWAHIGRVIATARKLIPITGANEEVVLAAIYCHDMVNLPKDHPDRARASELAALKAHPLLTNAGFSDDQIEQIKTAIIEHSFSRGQKPSSLESAIVQDSDRLDTLGAIGILRCASVSTQLKGRFYDPFDPTAEMRELDDKKFMLDHYETKLFKLSELMNTTAAKNLAEKRVEFMRRFVNQLLEEIR